LKEKLAAERSKNYRYKFILNIMIENIRATVGEDRLFVQDHLYSHPYPPEIYGVVPEIYAERGGVCIAGDVALGHHFGREFEKQKKLALWVKHGAGRHYWIGIPINYPIIDRQKKWQKDGLVTFHPFQI